LIYIDSNAFIFLFHDVKPVSDLVIKYLTEHERYSLA